MTKVICKVNPEIQVVDNIFRILKKVYFNILTFSFLAFLQKLFTVALGMLSGCLPNFFRIFLTRSSMARKSASALAW